MSQVGRIYFEDGTGYLASATYTVHPAFRAPEIRFQGRNWHQVRKLPEAWVYRTDQAPTGGDSIDTLTEVRTPGDLGWIAPSDYVASPSPAAVALAAFEKAVEELKKFPEHQILVTQIAMARTPYESPIL